MRIHYLFCAFFVVLNLREANSGDPYFRLGSSTLEVLRRLEITETISPECVRQTETWLDLLNATTNVLEIETWALQMIDSWGKLPEGILRGHVNAMGDFDECIGIRNAIAVAGPDGSGESIVAGKYCVARLALTEAFINTTIGTEFGKPLSSKRSLSIPELMNHVSQPFEGGLSVNPSLAVCFPSSCSQQDVQSLMYQYVLTAGIDQYVIPIVYTCTTGQDVGLGAAEIAMILFLALLSLALIGGTLFEHCMLRGEGNSSHLDTTLLRTLLAFSLITNGQKLFSTKIERQNSLTCLHGLRFLTICWIILGHTWFSLTMAAVWNTIEGRMLHSTGITMAVILNSLVSVDTFFTMSGLLVAYNLLRVLDKSEGKLNIPMLYLHRYIRLTPPLAIVIFFTATLWSKMGSGPHWFIVDQLAGFCRKSWWQNLLYINNFSQFGKTGAFGKENLQCLGHAWYVATDMQYYLLSPFLMYVIWRWKRVGFGLLSFLTLLSMLIPLLITYLGDLLPVSIQRAGHDKYQLDGYFRPWLRFGPYLIGIWTGYIIYHCKDSSYKLSRKILIAGWLISTCSALAVIFGPYSYWDPNIPIDKLDGVYAGFHRNVWAASIGWIIFCCTQGHGGFVNEILSWKPFLPLSRLTFCMYLISWPIQMIFVLRLRQPVVYDVYLTVNMFFAHLVITILVGTICTLAFESPFIQLENILFKRGEMSVESKPKDSTSHLVDVNHFNQRL